MTLPNEPIHMVTNKDKMLPPGFEIRVTDTVHAHDEHYDYTVRTYTLVAVADGVPEQPLMSADVTLTPEVQKGYESDAHLRANVEATFLRDLAACVNKIAAYRRRLIVTGSDSTS